MLFAITAFFAATLAIFLLADRTARILHNEFPTTWREIGSPGGFFWWSKDCKFWEACSARNRLMKSLIYGKPPWLNMDARFKTTQSALRLLAVLALLTWGIGLVLTIADH